MLIVKCRQTDSIELRNVVDRHEKNIDSELKMLQSGPLTGKYTRIKQSPRVFIFLKFS